MTEEGKYLDFIFKGYTRKKLWKDKNGRYYMENSGGHIFELYISGIDGVVRAKPCILELQKKYQRYLSK